MADQADPLSGAAPGGKEAQQPSGGDWWLAAAALAVTVVAAVVQGWQASDIVWGMWISSLVSGYAMILIIIAADVLHGRNPSDTGAEPSALTGRLTGALVMIAFFSFHFLFFHAGHAMFTQQFFPLEGADADPHDLVGNFLAVTPVALSAYWPMVVAAFAASGHVLRAALTGRALKSMALPYRAVVKNHVMIFIVAGLTMAGLEGWLLYALFVWYFVPGDVWRPLLARLMGSPQESRQE